MAVAAAGGAGGDATVRRVRLGLLLGFGAYACWGLLSPVGKHLLDSLPPLGMNAARFVLAMLVLLPALGPHAALQSIRLLRHRGLLWANLLANVSLTCFLFALDRLQPTEATLLFYSAPLWTAAWAHVRLREHVGWPFLPAAAGLLAGGYLALFGVAGDGIPRADPAGLLLALASAVLWAFYTVALRRVAPGIAVRPLMGNSFVAGSIYFALLALAVEGLPPVGRLDAAGWGWMALYVAVPTVGSFALFVAAVRLAPAGQVNILIAAELAFTALFAAILFGDRFAPAQLAGLALTIVAVAGYLAWRSRKPPADDAARAVMHGGTPPGPAAP
ncbi:MAG TPA: DMT family transporter [Candidatus Thermoplasmatota archaeon]|nr:DMT family transporter [Candidatus Thermoplasmatota archaeon]